MSLRDDIDTVADVADILAYQQRADMLAAQTAQLAALRDLRDQAQIQALRAEREKALQDTLFALRRSLPSIRSAVDHSPQKAVSDIAIAEQTLELVPPEAFSALEWKELSVTVRDALSELVERLRREHGEPMIQELGLVRDATRAVAAEERARALQESERREEAVRRQKEHESAMSALYTAIAIAIAFGLLIYVLAQTN
jgi:hypothetical protein